MAGTEKATGLFRKTAQDKIASPEQLDSYIKVASPSIWVALVAVLLFFAALAYWANTGKIPTTTTTNGAVVNGSVYCFVSASDVGKFQSGDTAKVLGLDGAYITSVGTKPVSSSEAAKLVTSDYSLSQLSLSDWNYVVLVTPTLEMQKKLGEGTAVPVVITTEESAPISFLFNNSNSQ